jgi:GT2 family glycosyltransferase
VAEICIVIPTCDRPELLRRCLRTIPGVGEAEIVVANDGAAIPSSVAEEFPAVRFSEGPKRGPAANRNHGARLSQSEWIVFLDDDCEPQLGWLAGFQRAIRAGAADLIEGAVEAAGWTGHPLDERVENRRGGAFWSCNLAVRRSMFEKSGGFDEDFRQAAFEDMEFAERLAGLGARTGFAAEARVLHPVRRLTLRQLWRRTLMKRWFALYLRKTRRLPNRAALLAIFAANALRSSKNHALTSDRARGIFLAAWEIFTLPMLLAYVCYWDAKFASAAR